MDLTQRTNSVFSGLSHPYRRVTVIIIVEMDEPVTLDELAREIATRSDQIGAEDYDSRSAERIRVELVHGHLPKLAEADLIEYDSDTNLVSSTPVTTHLTALIQIGYSIAEVM